MGLGDVHRAENEVQAQAGMWLHGPGTERAAKALGVVGEDRPSNTRPAPALLILALVAIVTQGLSVLLGAEPRPARSPRSLSPAFLETNPWVSQAWAPSIKTPFPSRPYRM